jgi:hypothetical protein
LENKNVRTPAATTSQADVAQLVEQPIRNRQVIGSSPIVGSIPTPFKQVSLRIFQVEIPEFRNFVFQNYTNGEFDGTSTSPKNECFAWPVFS